MTGAAVEPRRAELRLLGLLATGEGRFDGRGAIAVAGPEGLRRMRLDVDRLAVLVREGLVERVGGDAGRIALTAGGRACLARASRLGEIDGFRLQHGDVAAVSAADGEPRHVDHAESPLARLARRRDGDGRTLLSPARVAAGERLRADFTLARMMPTVTSNWSSGRIASGGGGSGGIAELTDRAVAARARVEKALAAVGGDLAGVLIDVCCFLEGLERVERARRWPVRSAKVVLDIALGRLADHYGFADEARGGEHAPRLRAWGTGDHRPSERRASP